jgi:hypothetical protein
MSQTENLFCSAGTPATVTRAGQLTGVMVVVQSGAGVVALQLNKVDLFRYFMTSSVDYFFWFPLLRDVQAGDQVSWDQSPAGGYANFQLNVLDAS